MAAKTASLGICTALLATLAAGLRVTRMGIAEALRAILRSASAHRDAAICGVVHESLIYFRSFLIKPAIGLAFENALAMSQDKQFFPRQVVEAGGNRWDWALLPIILALFVLLAYAAEQMARPYQLGEVLPLSLDPVNLPYYLLRTTLRMFIALGASIVFSCVFAVLATKYRAAEKVLVPMLDILQSIPILGFLSITVTGFIALFPGNLLGVECAAIFAIFTSQAWNMAFSLYQSFRTVPAGIAGGGAACSSSPAGSVSGGWICRLPCRGCCGT